MTRNRVDEFAADPKRALFSMAAPIMVAMITQALYNIVDTAFVGRLGPEAIAALTFSFPLFFILMAINSGLATGMNSRISRYLGEKDRKEAENAMLHAGLLSLGTGLVIFLLGKAFLRPIFVLFGAEGTVLALAMDYMGIILWGIFLMFPLFLLNQTFTAQGDTKTPMKVTIVALLINVVLDPLFIYVLGWGVKGAAIATVNAFLIGLLFMLHQIRRKSYLHLRPRSFRFRWELVSDILVVGIPAAAWMLLMSLYNIIINRIMAAFGTLHVATFGISARLESLTVMPMVAISIATLTLVGMLYGAKRYEELKRITWYAVKVTGILTAAIGAVFFALPRLFIQVFTPDAALIALGIPYIRITVISLPFMAMALVIARTMQGMGKGVPGLVISLTRIVALAIPFAFYFVYVLGWDYLSVAYAAIIGSAGSLLVALVWLKDCFVRLDRGQC
ncbi:MATE family efflux transporter [Candidatus Woesearchaeota archaeon]|nr:MATE family efflux transporter [Candidatus Woesearchaeota archaeon]